jgi:hypothetical protein
MFVKVWFFFNFILLIQQYLRFTISITETTTLKRNRLGHISSSAEFEDTKGVRIHISKKNRQHSGQKKKYKRTNSDLQNAYRTVTESLNVYKIVIT